MRLLNTQTWEMKEFISDDKHPPYAILSHTWGDEEISFQQWESRKTDKINDQMGYNKIIEFGKKAAENGYNWVWVDTCCIDKKSSAELSEAINAMYRWYSSAAVCYVYLADVSSTPSSPSTQMPSSRWFTRGWTLQELIAPSHLQFYTREWDLIGTKREHVLLLSSITGIDARVLLGNIGSLSDISIARRMSWASRRQTSRLEDTAYCLLGLFDINIPLIYGEGKRAFRRLQQAIMESTGHDQSLFAWGRKLPTAIDRLDLIDADQDDGLKQIQWKPEEERSPLLGLLADSPADFVHSADIDPVDHGFMHVLSRTSPPRMVNGGVLLDLVVYKRYMSAMYWDDVYRECGGRQQRGITRPEQVKLAILLCRIGDKGSKLVGLIIHSWGDGFASRTNELVAVEDLFVSHCRFDQWRSTMHLMPYRPFKLRHRDIIIRRWKTSYAQNLVSRPMLASGPAWRQQWGHRVLRLEEDAKGCEDITFFFEKPDYIGKNHRGLAVTFKRVLEENGTQLGQTPVSGNTTSDTSGRSVVARDLVGQHLDIGSLWVGASAFIHSWPGSSDEEGFSRTVPLDGRPFHESTVYHVMETPVDIWERVEPDWPSVFVRAERVLLNEGRDGIVDVVDCFIHPEGEAAERARRSIRTPR